VAAPVPFGAADAPAAFGTTEFQPKSYKLDFTMYGGSVDPLNWLTHCEQFFWGQCTPVEQRTWMASYHLIGVAQTWYYALFLGALQGAVPHSLRPTHLRLAVG
jgi:hypothetical protein